MLKRRQLLQLSAALLAARSLSSTSLSWATDQPVYSRPIPSSGENIPVVGVGTSRTFDVDGGAAELKPLQQVMQAFFGNGGSVIDSSPMYGKAEARVGDILKTLRPRPPVFAATKVWVEGREAGIAQMEESAKRMNVERFDLIAVHNLKDWRTHLKTLKQWKAEGKVRYIGITTSHGRNHEELLSVMQTEPLDFVQFSYNMEDRAAEKELFPTAADRGIATMINRPFQRGSLFDLTRGATLPDVARDLGCTSWAQFFLKFIIGHPATTCVIPATSNLKHMQDNMQANVGPMPDAAQREEMLKVLASLKAD